MSCIMNLSGVAAPAFGAYENAEDIVDKIQTQKNHSVFIIANIGLWYNDDELFEKVFFNSFFICLNLKFHVDFYSSFEYFYFINKFVAVNCRWFRLSWSGCLEWQVQRKRTILSFGTKLSVSIGSIPLGQVSTLTKEKPQKKESISFKIFL